MTSVSQFSHGHRHRGLSKFENSFHDSFDRNGHCVVIQLDLKSSIPNSHSQPQVNHFRNPLQKMPPNGSGHKDDHKDDSEKHRTSSFSTAGLDDGPFRLWKESCRLFQISLPSVLMQFALYFIFPLSASVVGRQLGP